jgi:long-chain acyl-CoA synthetase
MQSHRSLVLNCAYTATMHVRTPEDVVVTALPSAHVYGNVVLNSTWMAGGRVVLMTRFDPEGAIRRIEQHGATMFEGVPAMYATMLATPALAGADLSTLTRSTVGGQTIAESVIESWETRTGAPLIELWGMTELSGLGSTHALYAPNVHGSIGVALPGNELRVVSTEDGVTECRPGEPGELVARGPLVTLGYYHDDAATAEAITPEGWLRTGDVATHDGAGRFFVVDRLKDMILTAGYNVYPAEIERVLIGHASVALVAVGREPDEVKGEVAHAYVVPAPGSTPDAEELTGYCRQHLAAYKVPRAIHFVDQLPTTSSGKLMRRMLRQPDAAH